MTDGASPVHLLQVIDVVDGVSVRIPIHRHKVDIV